MNKKVIEMLDIVYFFVSQYGYEQVKLSPHDDDFWLFNRNHPKFQVIRLTTESMSKHKENKDVILEKAHKVGDLFNKNVELLNIHFTDEDLNLFFEPGYYQAQINENTISPMLLEHYPNIRIAQVSVGNDLRVEMDARQAKFEQFNKSRMSQAKIKARAKNREKAFGITHVIIIINVLVFLIGLFITSKSNANVSSIFMGALYKPLVYGANEWWRLFTAGFIHSDYLHLIVNMIALNQVGTMVERVYGKKEFGIIYIVSLLASSLLVLANENPFYVTLGASGAIFGLMGAVIVYLFSSGLYKVKAIRDQIIWTLAINLFISFLPGISMYGHFGGFVAGILAALAVSKANSIKSAVLPSIISLCVIMVSLLTYTTMFDEKLYPLNKKLDVVIVAGYHVLGFEDKSEKLYKMYVEYYKNVGEEFVLEIEE